jgi:hypothetical protein
LISQTKKLPRGVCTVEALKARCAVDLATHCWVWQRAVSNNQPRIHTFDHARGEKRVMPGSLAAWNIGHGAAPRPGKMVFRCCGRNLCVNPAHLREAGSLAEIGAHIRRSGRLVGSNLEQRRANMARAHASMGTRLTPRAVVEAIWAAPKTTTGRSLALTLGVSEATVSRFRTGTSSGVLVGAT